MPARTTARQRIIALLQEHAARPGDVVTESKILTDAVTGDKREVDVVIEGNVAGHDVVISVEVIDQGRTASVTWVEQQIKKHARLPTNSLLLVSWSGFSDPAYRAAESEGGWVVAVTPDAVRDGDVARRMPPLFVDQIRVTPTKFAVRGVNPSGVPFPVSPQPTAAVFKDGKEFGNLTALAHWLATCEPVMVKLGKLAHGSPDRDKFTAFTIGDEEFGKQQVYLRWEDDTGVVEPEFCLIEQLFVTGTFGFAQSELVLDVLQMRGVPFAAGQIQMFGNDSAWVATPDETHPDKKLKVSWRMIGNKPPSL